MLWSCLGVAASETGEVTGPWRQPAQPLFANDGGHGMIFSTYEGQLMLALHQPNTYPDERAVIIPIEMA